MRPLVAALLAAVMVAAIFLLDIEEGDLLFLALVPALPAVLTSRPGSWPQSYLSVAVASVLGQAAAAAAAIIDPSEHDSNLIFFTVVVFVFAGGLGIFGAFAGAPIAWVVSWLSGRLARSRAA